MSELAYSLHLGNDKNRKNVSRTRAKSNASGTTSKRLVIILKMI